MAEKHFQPILHPTVLTEDFLKTMVCRMLSEDRKTLKATVAQCYAPDVRFYHPLVAATSRDELYKIFRAYTHSFDSRPVFREIIVQGDRAFIWVDQHITGRSRMLPTALARLLPRAVVPTLVVLKFRPLPSGRPVVYEHWDHHSVYAAVWSFAPLSSWLFEHILQPLGTALLSATSDTLDLSGDMVAFIKVQFGMAKPPAAATGGIVAGGTSTIGSDGAGGGMPGLSSVPATAVDAAGGQYVPVHASPTGVGMRGAATVGML